MGALAGRIEARLDSTDVTNAEFDGLQKAMISVSGYTRDDGTHVSAYKRKGLLAKVRELAPGDSLSLPDGRRIGKDSKGRLILMNRGKTRGRRQNTPSEAVDALRLQSARDRTTESSLGGATRHTDLKRADREDRAAKIRAKAAIRRTERDQRQEERDASIPANDRKILEKYGGNYGDTPTPPVSFLTMYVGERPKNPTVAEIRKMSPEMRERYLGAVAREVQATVWGDNVTFRAADAYKRRLRNAGFTFPEVDTRPPPGFQD